MPETGPEYLITTEARDFVAEHPHVCQLGGEHQKATQHTPHPSGQLKPSSERHMRLVLDFSVFFFRVIFKYTATSKFDSRVPCTGAAAFFTWPRISVYRACTLDEPARVVKPHRKHAQNTTGEVRGEFQRRRVCACCRSRNTHGACALLGRFQVHIKRHPRLLLSLVETTITVDSHTHNEGACGFLVFRQRGFSEFRDRRTSEGD